MEQINKRHEEILQRIRGFRLMDDDFMTKCFEDSPECTELVLHIVLNKPDLKVQEVKVQYTIKNLQGRSVRLDIYATDGSGKKYNIEIQRADKGAGRKRARYNSSLMDTNTLLAGDDTEQLPETYVIFITEKDTIGKNKPLYHVERVIAETGESFGDDSHIIYVNGAYKDESPLGLLMKDFFCTNPADMHYKVLADRTRYFKEDKEGVATMCKAMEDMVLEEVTGTKKEIALSMIKDGALSLDKIATYVGLTIEEIKKLAKERTE